MKLPPDLRYTESHEWVRRESDGTVTIGITDHAQEQLGDIVFVEAPAPGRKVKAASDIYAPVAGEVVAANAALADAPEQVNADAFAAWMFRIKPDNPVDVDKLLDANAYQKAAAQ